MHLLAKEFSKFNEITVYDTNQLYGKMGKFRCLQFADDAIQGAIDLKDPMRIVLDYQRAMMHLMELNNPSFENVFIIGHGIGKIAGHYPDKRFKVAEIDEVVVEISKKFFGYSKNNVEVGDGREILKNEQPNSYDYIILDAFTHKGIPLHFTTLEFFEMTMEKLGSRGVIFMNVMGKPKNDWLLNGIYTTLREAFAYAKAFSLPAVDEGDVRNMIVMASNEAIDFKARNKKGVFEIELEKGHVIREFICKDPPFYKRMAGGIGPGIVSNRL
ncbi:spermidine synthase [Cohnella luojiensis]|uniref:Spermidine synthase n=1 Tax=Cohnella luojiensis TaxID=652876 RepID=A0A4Y8LYP4_9BACL|nr:fused MFS/spermidine synthase [Cohnella luojiensis]TFE26347.1 spermidine synthase [Cohnella luojiensis]